MSIFSLSFFISIRSKVLQRDTEGLLPTLFLFKTLSSFFTCCYYCVRGQASVVDLYVLKSNGSDTVKRCVKNLKLLKGILHVLKNKKESIFLELQKIPSRELFLLSFPQFNNNDDNNNNDRVGIPFVTTTPSLEQL